MSATFTVKCEFVTNDYRQAKEYTKLWMFAYRFGHLKFNIKYGYLRSIRCNVTLDESASIPIREDKTESESTYIIETNATIHGYVSKTLVETRPLLHEIRVSSDMNLDSSSDPRNGIFVSRQVWSLPNIARDNK